MLNFNLLVLGCSAVFAMTAGMPSMAGSSEKKEDKTAAAGEALPEMFLMEFRRCGSKVIP